MLNTALPWSRRHCTLRLILSVLDQCKFVCPHLSVRSPALAEEFKELLEELLEEGWYPRAA